MRICLHTGIRAACAAAVAVVTMVAPGAEPVPRVGALMGQAADTKASPRPLAVPRAGLLPFLQNGDFETTSPSGEPAHWVLFRQAFYDVDPPLAHGGQASVRLSAGLGWYQDIAVPVSPLQSFSLGGYAWREFDDEKAGIRAPFYDTQGNYVKDGQNRSPVMGPAGRYAPFWATVAAPIGAAQMQLFLTTDQVPSWLRFDDLQLFTEKLHEPGDRNGEPWTLADGAAAAGAGIELPPGASASQRVTQGVDNQQYFTWARYSAEAAATVTATEESLARGPMEVDLAGVTTRTLATPGGTAIFDTDLPLEKRTGYGRFTLATDAQSSVTFTSLRRGFAKVEPREFTSGPGSPDSTLTFTAVWPGHLTTATLTVLDPTSATVAVLPLQQYGTSVQAIWPAPLLTTSGTYTARFTMTAGDSEVAQVDRRFTVTYEPQFTQEVPASRATSFVRSAWLFLPGWAGADYIQRGFETLRSDGFNYTFVTCNDTQLPLVRASAEATQTPFVVFLPAGLQYSYAQVEHPWVGKVQFLRRLHELFAPVKDSPYFRGTYMADEFLSPEGIEAMSKVNKALVQEGTLGTPWLIMGFDLPQQIIDAVMPVVGVIDPYPFGRNLLKESSQALLDYLPGELSVVQRMAAVNRDTWVITQAFNGFTAEDFYPTTPATHLAQVGSALMAGARGYLTFYYMGNTNDPVRLADFSPSKITGAYQEANALIARLEPTLMALGTPQLVAGVPEPFAITTAPGPGGQRFVFALNADGDTTRTLHVKLSQPPAGPLQDLVGERTLPVLQDGNVAIELGPGRLALFSIGTAEVASATAVPAEPRVDTTIALPITHEFRVNGPINGGQPVFHVKLNPEADAVAATIGRVPYLPWGPQIYHLGLGGAVTQEPGSPRFGADTYGFDAGLYYHAASSYGFRYFVPGSFGAPENASPAYYAGHSGGAADVRLTADGAWANMTYRGLRQLRRGNGGELESAGVVANPWNGYGDILGTFPDGSITILVQGVGVQNVKPGQVGWQTTNFRIIHSVDIGGAIGPSNLLAVPRHQFGVALFPLGSNGEPGPPVEIATKLVDAVAVTWVGPGLLAVADGERAVVFYQIDDSLQAREIGRWRPTNTGTLAMMTLNAAGGRLAVGLFDGRVIVADIAPLLGPTAADSTWLGPELY